MGGFLAKPKPEVQLKSLLAEIGHEYTSKMTYLDALTLVNEALQKYANSETANREIAENQRKSDLNRAAHKNSCEEIARIEQSTKLKLEGLKETANAAEESLKDEIKGLELRLSEGQESLNALQAEEARLRSSVSEKRIIVTNLEAEISKQREDAAMSAQRTLQKEADTAMQVLQSITYQQQIDKEAFQRSMEELVQHSTEVITKLQIAAQQTSRVVTQTSEL